MKGTYDNNKYIFGIKRFHKAEDGNGYEWYQDYDFFDNFDGLTVAELFKHEKQKALESSWYGFDGYVLLCTSADQYGARPYEVLAEIYIDEKNLHASTIEYALACKMMSKYSKLNDPSKRMILTFLERYVADYQQVREFAQTGKNILKGVDPLFGISAQGTARPKGK